MDLVSSKRLLDTITDRPRGPLFSCPFCASAKPARIWAVTSTCVWDRTTFQETLLRQSSAGQQGTTHQIADYMTIKKRHSWILQEAGNYQDEFSWVLSSNEQRLFYQILPSVFYRSHCCSNFPSVDAWAACRKKWDRHNLSCSSGSGAAPLPLRLWPA